MKKDHYQDKMEICVSREKTYSQQANTNTQSMFTDTSTTIVLSN